MEDNISKLEKCKMYLSSLDLCGWNVELLKAKGKLKMCLDPNIRGM